MRSYASGASGNAISGALASPVSAKPTKRITPTFRLTVRPSISPMLGNSHDPYQGHCYVAIFPDDYASFPEPPALFFRGACIVIRGTIERYRGTAQIVLRDPDDVRIVPEP